MTMTNTAARESAGGAESASLTGKADIGAAAEGAVTVKPAAEDATTAHGGDVPVFEGSHVFYKSLHERYLLHIDDDPYSLESFFSQHLRMGGAYWTFTSLWLLNGSAAASSGRSGREKSSTEKLHHSTSSGVSQSDDVPCSATTGPASLVFSGNPFQDSSSSFRQSSSLSHSTADPQPSSLFEKKSASANPCLPVVLAAAAGATGTDTSPSGTTAVPVSVLHAGAAAAPPASSSSFPPSGSKAVSSNAVSPAFAARPSAFAASTVPPTPRHSDSLVPDVNGTVVSAAAAAAADGCGDSAGGCDLAAKSCPAAADAPARAFATLCATTREDRLTAWILSCQHSSGGFGQGPGQDPHITSTHYAVLLLLCMDRLHVVNREKVAAWVRQLRVAGGGFKGDIWGECDTRYAYCGAACLTLLGHFDRDTALQTAFYVQKCSNVDGGYAWVPGGESHAASAFCCIATLALCERLAVVEREKLASWLLERQLQTGGFNGRPEKAPDVCYSFWILAALAIIGYMHWVDTEALTKFVLEAQDERNGGIADRPGDLPDVFHTYFGIAALSLMHTVPGIKEVHPVFSIPREVARREKLGCCVLWG